MAKKAPSLKTVVTLKHAEATRKHIPSAEQQSLVQKEHEAPKTIRYPRNTDLDPQLVWRGNPPFNDSDWFRKDDDVRWHGAAAEKEQPQVDLQGSARQRRQFGVPPKGNANFAWVQHFIRLPVPPFDEQKEIMSARTVETAALTTAIARTEREIALMQEYRTRLTADLVTGKLDVRGAAAHLPAPPEDAAPELLPDEPMEEVEPAEAEA